jgi:hypothetical protein
MIDYVKNETLWFPTAIVIASVVTAILVARRATTARALSVFYGCTIGVMGSGHVIAVTIRALDGTLSDGLRWFLYPLGLVIAVPAWLLVASTTIRRMTILHAILIVVFVAQGPSATLAIPAVMNLIYLHVAKPAVRVAMVALSAVLYTGLFVTAMILASR